MAERDRNGKNPRTLKIPAAFEGLTEKAVGSLYNLATIKRLKRGEYLIREGDTDQTAFVILDGVISVNKDVQGAPVEIATLDEGNWVGEIAFTRRIRRTASALAKTPSSVMAIDQTTLDALDHETQLFFYRRLNDLAAQRVADLSERETELAGKNRQLIDYIASARGRDRSDYGASDMIRGVVSKVPKLPAFAANMAARLLGEDVAPAQVAEIVKEDPALTALVLKVVNSPRYGFKQKFDDIHQAVILLGFNEVYLLVLAEGIRRTMPRAPESNELFAHSVAMSRLSFALAQEAGSIPPTEASTIAMFHDVGYNVLRLLKDQNPKLTPLIDAMDVSQLGALLLREWQMPDAICRTVEHQFHPEFSPPERIPEVVRSQAAVLYLSHLSYDHLKNRPEDALPSAFLTDYIKQLGWDHADVDDMLRKRLLANLKKKFNTFPVSFRKLIAPKIKSAGLAA